MLTLGSLFDGIGGFPLAGVMCGITPVWASEIEPFPMKVTAARFPDMKQLGSVTDINGAEIEPVDIITFGSPCQDLSVAGKQLGIHEGQRSNLFFEAVRIIKEMRNADTANGRTGKHIRPRFAVWENVPGAFSSNKGEDFRAVLEAFASVCENDVSIPRPKKWQYGGAVAGHGWSLAWRVYDAQYWGVPQRRKRIYLVADFGSERAGEILFERESVRGDSAKGGTAGEGTAADAEGSVGGSRCFGIDQQGGKGTAAFAENVSPTLCSDSHGTPHGVCFEPKSLMEENWQEQTVKNALRVNASKSGHCIVQDRVKCLNPWDCQSKRQHDVTGCYPTLQAYNGGGGRCDGVVYALQGNGIDRADTAGCNGCGWRTDKMYTLNTIDRPAVAFQASGDRDNPGISVSDRAYCLAANPMSDRGQAVCFQQNQRDEVRNMGEQAGALTAQPGIHNQNYLCYPKIARSLCARADSSPCVDRGQNVVCYDACGIDGYNTESTGDVSITIRAGKSDQDHVGCVVYRNGGYGNMVEGVGTLRANGGDAGGVRRASSLSVFENHSQDTRYNGPVDVSQTVSATFGMGGNNTPFVVEKHE